MEKKNIFAVDSYNLEKGNIACRDIVSVGERYLYQSSQYSDDIFLLWSEEKKEFLLTCDIEYPHYIDLPPLKYLIYGTETPFNISEFNVPIHREPIELTKAQKKAQKNGTFTGKTCKEIIGKQPKIFSFDIKLYKSDLDFFKGYELKGVSAPQNK